jgi:tetratricopeptide (TPR) repeat protein
MVKGIYHQMLSRLLRKSENPETLLRSSAKGRMQRQNKYAYRALLSAFSMLKRGDVVSAEEAISKLLNLTVVGSKLYFASQLMLATGKLRLEQYEEAINSLSHAIEVCGHDVFGLCDALIIMSESYAALGQLEDALHSAKLAVDVAHDLLEASSKQPVIHTQAIISNTIEDPVGPCLDVPNALTTSYFTLATQLFHLGFQSQSFDWYSRAVSTSEKFDLDSTTSDFLKQYANRAIQSETRRSNSKINLRRRHDTVENSPHESDAVHRKSDLINSSGRHLSTNLRDKVPTERIKPLKTVTKKRLPWRPVSPFADSSTGVIFRDSKPKILVEKRESILHRGEVKSDDSDNIRQTATLLPPHDSGLRGSHIIHPSRSSKTQSIRLAAVLIIQSAGRSYIAKTKSRAILRHKRFERDRRIRRISAVIIQKNVRGFLSRQYGHRFEKKEPPNASTRMVKFPENKVTPQKEVNTYYIVSTFLFFFFFIFYIKNEHMYMMTGKDIVVIGESFRSKRFLSFCAWKAPADRFTAILPCRPYRRRVKWDHVRNRLHC